jgi:hypothetical protein
MSDCRENSIYPPTSTHHKGVIPTEAQWRDLQLFLFRRAIFTVPGEFNPTSDCPEILLETNALWVALKGHDFRTYP